MNQRTKKTRLSASIILFSLTAILLSACAGNAAEELRAVVEAQTQSEIPVVAEAAQADAVEEENLAEAEELSPSPEDEIAATEEELEITEEEVRTVPSLVLGSPTLHGSDPSTVSLASGRVQLVEFFAYWCPVCKRMAPTIHGLEDVYGEQINFVYLDRDDPATAKFRESLGYVYQPHYFLLNPDGKVLASWVGYVEGSVLQAAIETAIQ